MPKHRVSAITDLCLQQTQLGMVLLSLPSKSVKDAMLWCLLWVGLPGSCQGAIWSQSGSNCHCPTSVAHGASWFQRQALPIVFVWQYLWNHPQRPNNSQCPQDASATNNNMGQQLINCRNAANLDKAAIDNCSPRWYCISSQANILKHWKLLQC